MADLDVLKGEIMPVRFTVRDKDTSSLIDLSASTLTLKVYDRTSNTPAFTIAHAAFVTTAATAGQVDASCTFASMTGNYTGLLIADWTTTKRKMDFTIFVGDAAS
jgi:hypothetical protein